MFIKYPYIILGLTPIFVPLIMIFGFSAGMVYFVVPLMGDMLSEEKFTSSYDFMLDSNSTTLFIYPQYTFYANEENSLVDIGTDICDGCEKYEVLYNDEFWNSTVTSGNGLPILVHNKYSLDLGGYSDTGGSGIYTIGYRYFNMTNDNSVNIDPSILDKFDRIVLMRNVYVTENLRQSILNHDNVIYLFPDALTKQVSVQDIDDVILEKDNDVIIANATITYVGEYEPLHPMVPVWADDNRCEDWHFVPVQNGYMMNCIPDVAIINNYDMLIALRDIGTNQTISRP